MPGGLDIGEIADRTLLLGPSLSRIVANLADRGLVERAPSAADQRRVIVTLTYLGRGLVVAVGPSSEAIYDQIAKVTDVVLEIDYQGALQIKKLYANAVLIFILPPSWDELRGRLERRAEDSDDVIEVRLANARHEIVQAQHFNYVIINESFDRALFDLKAIVHAQRLKYAAQRRLHSETFTGLGLTSLDSID